jgi:hypothetical protein
VSTTPDSRDLTVGAAVSVFRAGVAVGRLGLAPVRVAARAPLLGPAIVEIEARGRRTREDATEQLALVLDRVLAGPLTEVVARSLVEQRVIERSVALVLDAVLAGPLTEVVARSLVEQRVVERIVAEVTARMDVGRAVADALDSPVVIEVTERFLASVEMRSAVAHIAGTPELRQALREQTSGLTEDMVGGLRRRSEVMDDKAERTVRGWWRRPRPRTT